MFIREIAALVEDFKGISENAMAAEGVLSQACRFSTNAFFTLALATFVLPSAGEIPRRRALKHERQYTGLPWFGWNGMVVDRPQSSQTAGCWVRLAGRAAAGGYLTVIKERTP